tara:strand:- start:222 stop:863 length:642 start_codon:yes stop_codon:yes gene_type:complete
MPTLSLGGQTLATQTGSDAPALGPVTLDANQSFPSGHIIQVKYGHDNSQGQYSSNQIPLGGSTGLTTGDFNPLKNNSSFFIMAQISSSWGHSSGGAYDADGGWTTMPTDWGLRIGRTLSNTLTYVGGATNSADRGGDNSYFGNDDASRGYAPYDTRVLVMNYIDTPGATTSENLKYEIGCFGTFQSPFNYNRIGHSTGGGSSASSIIVWEIAQ